VSSRTCQRQQSSVLTRRLHRRVNLIANMLRATYGDASIEPIAGARRLLRPASDRPGPDPAFMSGRASPRNAPRPSYARGQQNTRDYRQQRAALLAALVARSGEALEQPALLSSRRAQVGTPRRCRAFSPGPRRMSRLSPRRRNASPNQSYETPRAARRRNAAQSGRRADDVSPYATIWELNECSMSRSADRLRSSGEGPQAARPTTPGDHDAEVSAAQAPC
jgi:hypothetical protein